MEHLNSDQLKYSRLKLQLSSKFRTKTQQHFPFYCPRWKHSLMANSLLYQKLFVLLPGSSLYLWTVTEVCFESCLLCVSIIPETYHQDIKFYSRTKCPVADVPILLNIHLHYMWNMFFNFLINIITVQYNCYSRWRW